MPDHCIRRRDFGYYPTDAQAYELVAAVGEGATATVWLAYCPITDSDVAVKIVNLDDPSISLVGENPPLAPHAHRCC